MTDEKNESNDSKNIINKTYEISSAFESLSNSALMNYAITASNLSDTLLNISNAIPHESIRIVDKAATEALVSHLSKSLDIDSLPIDSLFLSESMRELGKTIQAASESMAINDMRRIKETLTNLTDSIAINPLIFENLQQVANTVQKMTVSIPNFSEMVSAIDWDTIDFTDSDIEEAEEMISSKFIEVVPEKTNKDTAVPQLPNSVTYIILLFIFILNNFSPLDFSLINIENMNISVEINTNEKIPSVESNVNSEKDSIKIPEKHIVNRIQKKIKQEMPKILLGTLGIITKSIYVYAKKRLDSKRIGKLNSFVVVKIIKQDRNWTYVLFQDSDGNIILEGWTLTRYIKKIT